jgi:hypothetical protein
MKPSVKIIHARFDFSFIRQFVTVLLFVSTNQGFDLNILRNCGYAWYGNGKCIRLSLPELRNDLILPD